VEADNGLRLLMDTGSTADRLLWNAEALGIDLASLNGVFISHWHGDHYGGLSGLLKRYGGGLKVFVPRKPSLTLGREVSRLGAELVEAKRAIELLPGFYSTGDLGGEHALVIALEDIGLVVLTGCSHPGPERMVEAAVENTGERPYALIGGLHISSYGRGAELGRFLNRAGLKLVCPCHCTGLRAREGLRASFTGAFVQCGAGRRIDIGRTDGGA